MECSKCGLPLLGTEQFCPQCGARLGQAPERRSRERPRPNGEPTTHSRPAGAQPRPVGHDESQPGTPAPVDPSDVPLAPAEAEESEEPDTLDVPLETAREEPPEFVAAEDEDEPELPFVEAAAIPAEPVRTQWQSPRRASTIRRPPPAYPPPQSAPEPQATGARRRAALVGPLGLGIVAGCLFLFILSLGALGVYQGQQIRAEKQKQEAAAHYEQGIAYLEEGDYNLAIAEFEYALRLRPNYLEAQQKLAEARAAGAQSTPSSSASPEQSSALLEEGRAAYERGAWDEAIQKLEALEALDPNYEQAAVRRLLAAAYTNSGLELVNANRLEEAIRRFSQALSVEPDNPDIQLQSQLATLYQSGLTAWGLEDWQKATHSLAAVYALQPDYKDTAERLYQGYVHAGNASGEELAWCDAADYYQLALDLTSSPDIAAKRDDAAHRCASAPEAGTPVPSGTFAGIFQGHEDNSHRARDWAQINGQVFDENGNPLPNIQVRVSAFDWSSNPVTTDGNGYFEFLVLTHEITYTVTLLGVPVQPVDVPAKFGYASIVDFVRQQ